ncbi:hypothetical protein SLEP1_g20200 [Rubroshorea leprosula]|uniref:Uncharacterized protein n=1 Tax=Rubroshorea leprosula TaxID=152421 RepID=A0AAV5J1W5_9ROSI|nr:hypothetical protein SLEP1_g20200 [Rubroshorea leprosula]
MALNKIVAVFSIWFACVLLLAIAAAAAETPVPSPTPASITQTPSAPITTPAPAPAPAPGSASGLLASFPLVMAGLIGFAVSFLALKEIA